MNFKIKANTKKNILIVPIYISNELEWAKVSREKAWTSVGIGFWNEPSHLSS